MWYSDEALYRWILIISASETQVESLDRGGDKSASVEDLSCRLVSDGDRDSWNAFVQSQPSANLGHSFEWKRVFEKAYGKKTYYFAALRGDQWVGVLPLVHMRGPLSGNRLVSLPFLDQAGCLARSSEASTVLLEGAKTLSLEVRSNGFDLRQRTPEPAEDTDRFTLIRDLSGGSEALWKSFAPKVRNQVRKAEKSGLATQSVEAGSLPVFYDIFARNMRDLGSPVHSLSFLNAVFERFASSARLYMTTDSNNRPVGGAIALSFKNLLTVPWASSLREVFPSCPNHSLYWRILADAADAGVELFDFGRSHRDSGTYKFKTQWGAVPQPLRWTSLDAKGNPKASKVYKPHEHQLLTRTWSRLPLWVTRRFGPLVRRQLSN
jgi:FemAB-related protein (PEP-CTERM system-associated)